MDFFSGEFRERIICKEEGDGMGVGAGGFVESHGRRSLAVLVSGGGIWLCSSLEGRVGTYRTNVGKTITSQ